MKVNITWLATSNCQNWTEFQIDCLPGQNYRQFSIDKKIKDYRYWIQRKKRNRPADKGRHPVPRIVLNLRVMQLFQKSM